MDTCHYCGFQYHPMPVYMLKNGQAGDDVRNWWTNGPPLKSARPTRINVCHMRMYRDESGEPQFDFSWQECRQKAEANGYEFRSDLTPKR